jgi:hypothetical protein
MNADRVEELMDMCGETPGGIKDALRWALEQNTALEIEKAKVARGMALAKRLRRNGAGDRAIWIEAALTEQVHEQVHP